MKKTSEVPPERHIYRYEVELKELSTNISRRVPLQVLQAIHLTAMNGEPLKPPRELLRLQDGKVVVEAESFEDFRARLAERYPDAAYERRLHAWRDLEAEERRIRALNDLAQTIAKAVVEDLLKSEGAPSST